MSNGHEKPLPATPEGKDPTPVKLWDSKDFIAGTAAGVTICLVGHPFDTVKVRLQTQPLGKQRLFTGGLDCVRQTVQKEGVRALYKGLGSPLSTVPIINAVVFASYEHGKRLVRYDPEFSNETWKIVLAGTYCGFVNSFIIGPVDLVKARLQVQYDTDSSKSRYRGSWDATRKIVRSSGMRGLFKGMVPTILREVPAYTAQFTVYEFVKAFLLQRANPEVGLSTAAQLTAGGCAGIAAWIFSYPQDVVKVQIQVRHESQKQYRHRFFDGGFTDCWQDIVRRESWRGLWKGLSPCLIRAFLANGAGFLAYEKAVKYLNSAHDDEEES